MGSLVPKQAPITARHSLKVGQPVLSFPHSILTSYISQLASLTAQPRQALLGLGRG